MSERAPVEEEQSGRQTADQTARRAENNKASSYLANERTMLAWIRTSIAVMGLGFVVARFGILIRELRVRGSSISTLPTGVSTGIGVALVMVGAGLLLVALLRYLKNGRDIATGEYHWSPVLAILFGSSLVAIGMLLALYLVLSA